MPLYEFECLDCGNCFEVLILRQSEAPVCPGCQSANLERLISLFSVDSETTRQSSLKIARSKNSKVNRDKTIAENEAMRHHDD